MKRLLFVSAISLLLCATSSCSGVGEGEGEGEGEGSEGEGDGAEGEGEGEGDVGEGEGEGDVGEGEGDAGEGEGEGEGEGDGSVCDAVVDDTAFEHQVHHFESSDGAVFVALQRDFEGLGGGLTSDWGLAWMRVGRGGPCITDPAALAYVFTHHNFEDEAHATLGGVEHVVAAHIRTISPFDIFTDYTTLDDTGAPIGAPIELIHTAGPSWPF